jgi:CRISPR-associated protein Cmr1
MPRTIKIPAPTLTEPKLETWTLKLKTITPVFGGSATPREVDQQNPVRSASVRGHLRFWWRAVVGRQYASAEALFQAEEEVWGSAQKQGKVAIKVSLESPGVRKSHPDFVSGYGDARGYALFPFAANPKQGTPPASCLQDVVFSLDLTCPSSVRPEVEQAVYAWVMLGGIGARTRRGCGSLELVSKAVMSIEPQPLGRSRITLVPASYWVGEKGRDALRAWKRALEVYKEFRQGVPYARKEGRERNRPGRSKWPEADSLRRLSGRNSPDHKPSHPVNGFPRADLGLPIVFHFKDRGDPPDYVLESAYTYGSRFASPVITKAVVVEGEYAPAIILLDAPHVWEVGDLKFDQQKKTITRAEVELSPGQLRQIEPLNGKPIREALIEFVKSRGFKEVRL